MKKKLFSVLFALVLVLSFSLATAVPVAAQENYYVATDGSDEFGDGTENYVDNDPAGWGVEDTGPWATIQHAVDNVPAESTINVAAGYYTGGAWIEKNLSLVGDGASTTTVDSTGTGYVSTIHVVGHCCNVSGFTIKGDLASSGTGSGRGIGYYGGGALGTIENNVVTASSHGIFIFGGASPTITNNTITGNGPGISNNKSSPTITNNIIAENGDAICNTGDPSGGSSPTITNNTITANGNGITNSGNSHPTITNNIISSHSGVGIWAAWNSTPTVTYNDVWGNNADYGDAATPGDGSISLDPLLDETYHLTASSPCIDAGTDAGVDTDMDGDTRPQGRGFDIGADEYLPNTVVGLAGETPEITAINVDPTSIDFGTIYPGDTVSGGEITVENIGTVTVQVNASLDNTTGVFQYLYLNGHNEPSGVWSPITGMETLLPTDSPSCTTELQVLSTYSAKGAETAILTFTARTK